MTMNVGIIVSWKGMISVKRISRKSSVEPRNLSRANA
jgi:hypothetical protein